MYKGNIMGTVFRSSNRRGRDRRILADATVASLPARP